MGHIRNQKKTNEVNDIIVQKCHTITSGLEKPRPGSPWTESGGSDLSKIGVLRFKEWGNLPEDVVVFKPHVCFQFYDLVYVL